MTLPKDGYFDTINMVHRKYTKKIQSLIGLVLAGPKGITQRDAEKLYGIKRFSDQISKIRPKPENYPQIKIESFKKFDYFEGHDPVPATGYRIAGPFHAGKAINYLHEKGVDFADAGIDTELVLNSFRQEHCHQHDLELDE